MSLTIETRTSPSALLWKLSEIYMSNVDSVENAVKEVIELLENAIRNTILKVD
jgi:hypothetical protein